MHLPHSIFVGIAFSSLALAQLDTSQAYCGWQTYGSPSFEDCRNLLESFASNLDSKVRIFDEEQQRASRDGSWPGLGGIVDAGRLGDAIQIPRYYSLSQSYL